MRKAAMRASLGAAERFLLLMRFLVLGAGIALLTSCAATTPLSSGARISLLGFSEPPVAAQDVIPLPTDQDYILILHSNPSLGGAVGAISFKLSQGPVNVVPANPSVTITPLGATLNSRSSLGWYYLASADQSAVGEKFQVEAEYTYSYLHTFPLGSRQKGPFTRKERFTLAVMPHQFAAEKAENWHSEVLLLQKLPAGAKIARNFGEILVGPRLIWGSENATLKELKKKALDSGANVITNLQLIPPPPYLSGSAYMGAGFRATAFLVER